jgi:hypothetical protein
VDQDGDSAVIKRYGILNALIAPGEGKEMRWDGIPYPGTDVTDGGVRRRPPARGWRRRARRPAAVAGPRLLDMPLVGGAVPVWEGEVTVTVPLATLVEPDGIKTYMDRLPRP